MKDSGHEQHRRLPATTARRPRPGEGPDRPIPEVRLAAVAVTVAAIAAVLKLTGTLDHLSFASLARNREWLVGQVEALGAAAPVVFVLVYAACTALSLPTGLLLSTLGGFLFGTWWGGLGNVVGATLGATAVFAVARACSATSCGPAPGGS
jgi:uncharacterized membrane protein YdjX (TVP38/TMEM64 family)